MPENTFSAKDIGEYHRMELAEIFERTRAISNQRIQFVSLFGTISITLLGFAFTTQKVGLIFLAIGASFGLIAIDRFLRMNSDIVMCRGIQLENMHSPDNESSLIHALVASSSDTNLLIRLSSIAAMENQAERAKALRAFRSSVFGFGLPLLIIVFEFVLGMVLWLFVGWQWF